MAMRKTRHPSSPELSFPFSGDRRDRRPGTHFAAELGAPSRKRRKRAPAEDGDPHVDEDLGVSAFGIDLPFLKH